MHTQTFSRRSFVKKTAIGLGAGMLPLPNRTSPRPRPERLPREVWIGTISSQGLQAADTSEMVQKVLGIMESLVPYEPDIICLPEVFAYTYVQQRQKIKEAAEAIPGPVVSPIAAFAKEHACYVICPTYIREKGDAYISAVLIDRSGKAVGAYHKARPTDTEIAAGIRPGPLNPPLFETDFGKIGIQICFDIKWEGGWRILQEAGAEIIFWPSAYGGGREVRSRAWRHQVHVVSSTLKGTSKICDVTGEVIAQTNSWQPNWACAAINLEKAFLHCWPAVRVFPDIQQKYGRRIQLTTFAEEEWAIIESRDPELKVADVLTEFGLATHQAHLSQIARIQAQHR